MRLLRNLCEGVIDLQPLEGTASSSTGETRYMYHEIIFARYRSNQTGRESCLPLSCGANELRMRESLHHLSNDQKLWCTLIKIH